MFTGEVTANSASLDRSLAAKRDRLQSIAQRMLAHDIPRAGYNSREIGLQIQDTERRLQKEQLYRKQENNLMRMKTLEWENQEKERRLELLHKREQYARDLAEQNESKQTILPEATSQYASTFGVTDEEAGRRQDKIRLQKQWLEDQMKEKQAARAKTDILPIEAPVDIQSSWRREHYRRVAQFNEQMASQKPPVDTKLAPSLVSLPPGISHTKQTDYRGVRRQKEAVLLRTENERLIALKMMNEASRVAEEETFHRKTEMRLEEEARREEEKTRTRKEAQRRAVEESKANADHVSYARKHADHQNDLLSGEYDDRFFNKRFGNSLF